MSHIMLMNFIGKKEVFVMRTESAGILVQNAIGLLRRVRFDDPAKMKEYLSNLTVVESNFDVRFAGAFVDFELVKRLESLGAERLCYVALEFEQEMATANSSSLEK